MDLGVGYRNIFYLSSSSIMLDLTRQDEFVKDHMLIFKTMRD